MTPTRIPAILRAQWRSLWNLRLAKGRGGRLLGLALALVWYGLWTLLAISAAVLLASARRLDDIAATLPWALMLVLGYWQLPPVLTAGLGAGLNLEKLLIFPIPERELFVIEVLLRLTTGLEMLLVLCGVALGLLLNPAAPGAAVLAALVLFALLNLTLAAGLRNLLERLVARKHVQEALVLLLVLGAAMPQLIALTGVPPFVKTALAQGMPGAWPWNAAAHVAVGHGTLADWAALGAWTLAACLFGRWQFSRSLRHDAARVASAARPAPRSGPWADRLYRLPERFLPDPLAALVGKELRSLFRTPRFRLVFLMGFTFGFLIWAPLWQNHRIRLLPAPEDLAVLMSVYALLLLSEVVFWNVLGFDRAAVQFYFSAPASFATVLLAKNLAAGVVVLLEVSLITAVTLALRLPVTAAKIVETYAVLLILSVYMTAAGNLSSLYWARPVNPDHAWGRTSRGRSHALMVLGFPLLGLPVIAAYVARHFLESRGIFAGGLALAALIGLAAYRAALRAAARRADCERETLLALLIPGAGPVTG
ncbi:MAG: hypothetical protein FJW34_07065 [Acidobacteria bacterium]|nr:hypothetical protein [Acidobacteriota bacterium]